MKITIGIVGALGLIFLGCGWATDRFSPQQVSQSKSAEKEKLMQSVSGSIIPYVIGFALLAGDVALILTYALYRLFTS